MASIVRCITTLPGGHPARCRGHEDSNCQVLVLHFHSDEMSVVGSGWVWIDDPDAFAGGVYRVQDFHGGAGVGLPTTEIR